MPPRVRKSTSNVPASRKAERDVPPPDVAPQETVIDVESAGAEPEQGQEQPMPEVSVWMEFHGQRLRAVMPDPAQLAVMQMLADRYRSGGAGIEELKTPEQLIHALQRTITMLTGIFPDGREFLEDLMMRRELDLPGLSALMTEATRLLIASVEQQQQQDPPNRAGRRAAGKKRSAQLVTGQ